jgi:hypothetical protein
MLAPGADHDDGNTGFEKEIRGFAPNLPNYPAAYFISAPIPLDIKRERLCPHLATGYMMLLYRTVVRGATTQGVRYAHGTPMAPHELAGLTAL